MKKERGKIERNKFYKTNPRGGNGISLIVLVITIIVIIILATAIIVTIINNNPMSEANEARIKSDLSNMQMIFTNAIGKIMAEKQVTIEIEANLLNSVTSGEKSAVGNALYTLSDGTTGQVIFDTLDNNQNNYYTGSKLPLYNKETKWYVDDEGIISLELGNKKYGDGKIIKNIKIVTEVKENEGYVKDKATVKIEIESEDEISSILFSGENIAVTEKKDGKVIVEVEVTENGIYEIEVNGKNGANKKVSVEVNEIEDLDKDIDIKSTVTPTSGYVKANIGLDITYSGEIESIKINDESIAVPTKQNGKYVISKQVLENGEYNVEVKSKNGTVNKVVVKVDQITEDMEIWNRADMENFRNKVNSGRTFEGKTVKLMDNINLEGSESNKWTPIANYRTNSALVFKGTFDGNSKTISNLYINIAAGAQGLFGKIDKATIKNLTITGGKVQVSGSVNQASSAVIVSRAYNSSKISNCTNRVPLTQTGTVNMTIGSMVGELFTSSTINGCKNYGAITASNNKYNVGGIVGANTSGGAIILCQNHAKIQLSSGGSVGGIVSNLASGSISKCMNKGEIKLINANQWKNAGGIAAALQAGRNIDSCFNTANITLSGVKDGRAGGIVGTAINNNVISNCYNRGKISASGETMVDSAGIVAHEDTSPVTIRNCYSVSTLVGTRNDPICAYGGTQTNCYSTSAVTPAKLGGAFKADSNKINAGLPILTWQ